MIKTLTPDNKHNIVLKATESESNIEPEQDLSAESSTRTADVQDVPLIVTRSGVPLVIQPHPDLMSSPDELTKPSGPEVRTSSG